MGGLSPPFSNILKHPLFFCGSIPAGKERPPAGGREEPMSNQVSTAPGRGAPFKRSLMSKAHIRLEDFKVPENRRSTAAQQQDDRRRRLTMLLAAMGALALLCLLINYAVYS